MFVNLRRTLKRKNIILLRELVITDFKLRYQGSFLGYVWSLLRPLLLFAIMYLVFVYFLRFGEGIEHFAVSLLLGIVMWTFFSEATNQGMRAIIDRGDLLRKINFPKYILVISATISALINFTLNLIVVFVFMLLDGVNFGWTALLFPFTILLLYIFSLSLAFFLAAVNVKFRDIGHIWEILLQALFYATPILYPVQMVMAFSVTAAQFLLLNPLAALFQNSRAQLFGYENVVTPSQLFSSTLWLAIPYMIILATIFISIWYFRRSQSKFAEIV